MSPPNVSLLFPHRDRLEIRGYQDFATGLSTGDNRSAADFLDMITSSAGSVLTKLYRV
jgi:hypothetical protein